MSNDNSIIIEQLETLIPRLMDEYKIIGSSISLIQNAEVFWERGFGITDKESRIPVTTATTFEAASLSKPVVAYLTLQLVDEGIIELDKPLINYLSKPYLVNQPKQTLITARHVLTHTTGFPNWSRIQGSPKIFFTPGKRFSYSGEGFMYLQKVLEELTGKSLENLAQKKILRPLGITHASFLWTKEIEDFSAQGYLKDGSIKKYKPQKANAAGSLQIAPSEYAKFIISLLDENKTFSNKLSNKLMDEMFTPAIPVNDAGLGHKHNIPYNKIIESESVFWGLGWGLERSEEGFNFWHWGNNSSFHSIIFANKKNQSGFIFMSNCEESPKIWQEILKVAFQGKHLGFEWLMSHYWD